jgi:alpha-galactosidase
MRFAFLCLLISHPLLVESLDNGVGQKPVLGFNSWNVFACQVNETVMKSTMDLFVSTGLLAAGYEYVSTDDCWSIGRDAHGVLQADPVSFPSGMAALADYAHAHGLKFGLYSSNSPKTCAQRPGSYGYETLDAATFASWSVDLLKYDNCGDQKEIGQPESRYPVMRDALNATGRPIVFAGCEWAVDFPATWGAPVMNR